MTELSSIDKQIEVLGDWIVRAARSLIEFYNEERGLFWRDSVGVGKQDDHMYPTSTNRCFLALCEYLRFLEEEGLYEREGYSGDRVATILQQVIDTYFGVILKDSVPSNELPKDLLRRIDGGQLDYISICVNENTGDEEHNLSGLDVVRWSSTNQWNMFTDALILSTVGMLGGVSRMLKWRDKEPQVDVHSIRERVSYLAACRLDELAESPEAGRSHREDDFHDFVTLYAVRGLDIFYTVEGEKMLRVEQKVRRRVREEVLRLLAYRAADVSSHFDPAELAFCISLLNRFPTPEADSLTRCAVKDIVDSQAKDGAWPTARLITSDGQGLLHVPSYEVALVLTQLLIRRINQGDLSFYSKVEESLGRAFNLVKANFDTVPIGATLDTEDPQSTMQGWSNDRIQRHNIVESWITSVVLTFLINYRDVLINLRQALILDKYNTRSSTVSLSMPYLRWPDMLPMLRTESQLDSLRIDGISDPTPDARLSTAIKSLILQPIADSPIHKPGHSLKHGRAGVSLILYGPPGTRKTTLVGTIAEALNWPQVVLSPPYFLSKGGLEGFDASAEEIFTDLLRLRRVVVLFDECEEFFKSRQLTKGQTKHDPGSRTTGAFITAGMLPRLQKLRDEQWVIFVLATNLEDLEDLDDAVRRPGRFDFSERIGTPTLEAQRRYVDKNKKLDREQELRTAIKAALQNIAHDTEGSNSRPDLRETEISFAAIDRTIDRFRGISRQSDNAIDQTSSIEVFIRRLIMNPPSLTKELRWYQDEPQPNDS